LTGIGNIKKIESHGAGVGRMRDDGRQSGDEERNDMTVIGQARYWA